MVSVLSILAILGGLASFIFFIIVLIKLFETKGALHGILGIFCALYTFIWGWMNADRLGIRKTMLYWTVAILAQIVLQVGAIALAGGVPTTTVTPTLP